ncbi:hypothetical protein MO867_04105 [Microbulbifer sp. OS29]|uniref:Uncharacterized protein n=1 Tax=Microbulbifer okhotskensis TaxID=2926617 RepID=A0A9X2EPT0_9GAMM|nr:DUF6586 family protein [Microbulbifer okhotskensis]MCO1333518.1 hypothetical protein [Microbulbifer okhotskensis]
MSNPYTVHVTSALRKSQLLLQLPCEISLQRSALEEAALLQLWKAYQAFLAEQAAQLQLGFEPDSPQLMVDALKAQGRASADANELADLLKDSGSWLSHMLSAWTALQELSVIAKEKKQKVNLIPLHNESLGSDLTILSQEQLLQWHQALSELVRRQRALLDEC